VYHVFLHPIFKVTYVNPPSAKSTQFRLPFTSQNPSGLALASGTCVPKKYEKLWKKQRNEKGLEIFGGIPCSKSAWATTETKDVGRGTTSIVSGDRIFWNLEARAKSPLQTVSIHSPQSRDRIKKHRRR